MMVIAVTRIVYVLVLKPRHSLLQWCLHNNKDAIKASRRATSLTLAIAQGDF